jgi:hypothetical protein
MVMQDKAKRKWDRRGFFGTAVAGALMESALGAGKDALPRPTETRKGDMLYRSSGKTGETVSVIGVRAGRRRGSISGCEKGRQDSIHRVHRPQRRGTPPAHAQRGSGRRIPFRRRAISFQLDGLELPQLRPRSHAGALKDQTMKPMGDKFTLESKTVTPAECLQYALSQPA